jgi:cytochrome P450
MALFNKKFLPFEIQNIRRYEKEYGEIAKVTFGTRNFFIISNPDHFKQILVTDWKKYGRDPVLQQNSLFKKVSLFGLNPGDEWKRHRSLLSPSFSNINLKKEFETSIDKITNNLMEHWSKFADKNGEIDASQDFGALTLDAIGISGFGKEFKSIENQDKKYTNLIDQLFKSLIFGAILPKFVLSLPIPFLKKIFDSRESWKVYLRDIVEVRKNELEKSDKEGYSFEKTDLLSKMMKSPIKEENPFDDDELLAEINTFVAAGYET